jgi:hypothetical protein
MALGLVCFVELIGTSDGAPEAQASGSQFQGSSGFMNLDPGQQLQAFSAPDMSGFYGGFLTGGRSSSPWSVGAMQTFHTDAGSSAQPAQEDVNMTSLLVGNAASEPLIVDWESSKVIMFAFGVSSYLSWLGVIVEPSQ